MPPSPSPFWARGSMHMYFSTPIPDSPIALRYMHMPIKGSVELSTNHVALYPASRTKYPPPRDAVVIQSVDNKKADLPLL
jgi:hypothetical protein